MPMPTACYGQPMPPSAPAAPFHVYPATSRSTTRPRRLAPGRAELTRSRPSRPPVFYAPIPQLDEWPLSRMAAASRAAAPRQRTVRRRRRALPQPSPSRAARPAAADRLGAAARRRAGRHRPRSPAAARSAAARPGARLTYAFHRAARRDRCAPARRSAAAAAAKSRRGVRVTPFRSIPVVADRRAPPGASADWRRPHRPSPCSPKAGSTSGRCRGTSTLDAYAQARRGRLRQPRPVRRRRRHPHPAGVRRASRRASACGAGPSRASTASMPGRACRCASRRNMRVHLD